MTRKTPASVGVLSYGHPNRVQPYQLGPFSKEGAATRELGEAKSAIEEHERLQKNIFPDLNLGLLHGRMTGTEKDAVMNDFREQSYQILVSTAVVEVGIDIPNASSMLDKSRQIITMETAFGFSLANKEMSSMELFCVFMLFLFAIPVYTGLAEFINKNIEKITSEFNSAKFYKCFRQNSRSS